MTSTPHLDKLVTLKISSYLLPSVNDIAVTASKWFRLCQQGSASKLLYMIEQEMRQSYFEINMKLTSHQFAQLDHVQKGQLAFGVLTTCDPQRDPKGQYEVGHSIAHDVHQ